MIWASTREGVVTYVGPEWTVFTGQSTDAALGNGWLEMLHAEDRERTVKFYKAACATISSFTIAYRLYFIESSNYVKVVAGAVPSISPVDNSFIGFLGTINEIENRLDAANTFGRAIIKQSSQATKPLTPVDIIADYLLLARATAQNANETRLLASIDFAVSEVMRRLGFNAPTTAH